MDEVTLDIMALTEKKMVEHEEIYSSISTRKRESFATKAKKTQTRGTLGKKGGVAILVKEYLAEHTVKIEAGVKGYLVAIQIRLPKAMSALIIIASYNSPNRLDDGDRILRSIAEKVKEIKESHSGDMLVWAGDMHIHIGDMTAYKGMDGSVNLDAHHDFDAKRSGRSKKLRGNLISTKGEMKVMNGRQGEGSQRTVRDGGIHNLMIITENIKSAYQLTVALPETIMQKSV